MENISWLTNEDIAARDKADAEARERKAAKARVAELTAKVEVQELRICELELDMERWARLLVPADTVFTPTEKGWAAQVEPAGGGEPVTVVAMLKEGK